MQQPRQGGSRSDVHLSHSCSAGSRYRRARIEKTPTGTYHAQTGRLYGCQPLAAAGQQTKHPRTDPAPVDALFAMNRPIAQQANLTEDESLREQASQVAALTLSFWLIKTVLTTAGDATGDLLSQTLGLGYTSSLLVALLIVLSLLGAQARATGFNASIYWALIFAVSTTGTELSDAMDRALGLGSVFGTLGFFLCLLAVLAIWCVCSRPIPIYPIITQRDALFYWFTAIFANSLGSAFGDLIGGPFGVRLLGAIAINVGLVAFVILLHYRTRINKAALFWAAFVFTRA